jgi:hypothetical protein
VEEHKKSLFGDTLDEESTLPKPSEKMFISGDLSSYSLPEQFLKEKKTMSDFLKGFLFCCFCCFLFFVLIIITGSVEEEDETNTEEFFTSDGEQKNISYVLNPLWDVEEGCDLDIRTDNYEYNFNRKCWKNEVEGVLPITLYQSDIEIGTFVEFEVYKNWDEPGRISNFFVNESNLRTNFSVALTEYTYVSELGFNLIITPENGKIENYWINKKNNCYYSQSSKCTLTIGWESEVGFIDLNSEIIIISLEEPLSKGTSLEIEYYSYEYSAIEDLMILFLWLPPIIFVVGIGSMIYNKKSQMVAGASAAVLPAIIITAIISSIIFEILY